MKGKLLTGLKTGFRLVLLLVGLVLLLVVAAIGSLGFEKGRLFWANQALKFAQTDALTVVVDGLRWPSLGEINIDAVWVTQQSKPVSELTGVKLAIVVPNSLQAARHYKPHVKWLEVDRAVIYQPAPTEPLPKEESQPLELVIPSLPAFKVDRITLGYVQLRDFVWPKDIAPRPLSIDAHAQAHWDEAFLAEWVITEWTQPGKQALTPLLTLKAHSKQEQNLNMSDEEPNTQEGVESLNLSLRLQQAKGEWLSQWSGLPTDDAIDVIVELNAKQATTAGGSEAIELAIQQIATQLAGHSILLKGDVAVMLDEPALTLQPITLELDQQSHTIKGHIDQAAMQLDINIDEFDLTVAQPWVPDLRSGHLNIVGGLDWVYQETPLPQGQFSADGAVVYNDADATMRLQGKLAGETLTLRQFKVQADEMVLNAKGRINASGQRSALTMTLTHLHDETLRKFLPASVAQSVPTGLDLHVQKMGALVRGDIRNPIVIGEVNALGVYDKTPFTLFGHTNIKDRKIRLQGIQADVDRASLAIDGVIDLQGDTTDITGTLRQLSPELAYRHDLPLPPGIVGSVRADWTIKGALSAPNIALNAAFQGGYEGEYQVLPIKFNVDATSQLGDLDNLSVDIAELSLATLSRPIAKIKGTVNANDNDLSIAIQRLPTELLGALGVSVGDGRAHARLKLKGTFTEPTLGGYISYAEDISVRDADDKPIEVPLIWHTNIGSESKDLLVDSSFTLDSSNVGQIEVALPWHDYLQSVLPSSSNPSSNVAPSAIPSSKKSTPLLGHLKTDLDVSALQLFIDTDLTTLRGRLESDLQLDGTVAKPQILGDMSFSEGYLKLASTGTELIDIALNAKAQGQKITIAKGQASDNQNGSLELTGYVDWSDLKSDKMVNVLLQANEAYLIDIPNASGALSGELSLAGGMEELAVNGDLQLQPLNISINSTPAASIPSIDVIEVDIEEDEAPEETQVVPDVLLDITVNIDQQAFVRGRGLDAELAGKVKVKGTAKDPQITGAFKTLRGELKFLQKPLKLNEGRAQFSNNAFNFHIPATYQKDDTDITILVSGTQDNIDLELSSVPSLPEEEILSLLLFGDSVENITAIEAISLARAINTLSNGSSFDPLNETRELLGFDSLSVGQDSAANGGGVNVGVGKYINERVYLEVERSSNPARPWVGNLTIELTDKLQLNSSTSGSGNAAAALEWRKDY